MAKLAKLGKIITGNTPKTAEAQNYASNDICFVKPSDFADGEVNHILDTEFYISEYARDKARIIPPSSVLVTCIGIVGKVAINKIECAFNQQINAIIPDVATCLPEYLALAIQSKQAVLRDIANAAVVPILNKAQFSEIDIYLPSLEEQREIVTRMDAVAKLIALRKEQLAKLDELVKARFVELFGDPVRNEKRWSRVPLSAIIESIDNGKSFVCDSSARQGNWPAVLKLSAATYGYYRPEENKAVIDENQFISDAAVRNGDLLFTRKNTPELVGMCAYVYDTPKRLMMPDLIFRLNTTDECNKVFLWKLINHKLFRSSIQAIATGSAKSMSNISKERLLDLQIILPPIMMQEEFAAFVEQTNKTKLTIQASLDKLEVMKKALMQEYFG